MFEIFPWNPHLETGIALIDQQHRMLVNLINRLAEQHVQGGSEAEVLAILGELADYADYHFQTEEGIWHSALAGDAWLQAHIATHKAFFAHIAELRSGNRPFQAVLDDLFSYLVQWLAYHILDNDKRMALAVAGVQSGLGLDAARAQADTQMQGATATLIQTVLGMYQALSSQALELMHEKLARQRAEQALRDNESRWRFLLDTTAPTDTSGWQLEHHLSEIIDHLPAGLVVADANTHRFVFVNPWFCNMLGYTRDELLGLRTLDIHPPEALARLQADMASLRMGQNIPALEMPVKRKDGSVFMASIERAAIELDTNACAMAVFTDVTERQVAAALLEAERLRLQNAIDAAQAGTWEWDLPTQTVRYNARSAHMLGELDNSPPESPLDAFLSRLHPDDLAKEQQQMSRHLKGDLPRFEVEVRARHHDGHWVWCRALGRVSQRNANGEPQRVTGIAIDISEQKSHREHIDHLTRHDALTGLPNRKSFVEQLGLAMAACGPEGQLAVAYLDLDGLAAINDAHGLDVGSQLIVQTSRRLAHALQTHQSLGHIGGDEFAVILTHLPADVVPATLVSHLMRAVSEPITLDGHPLQVTASVGITLYPQHDRLDAEQLLRQADQAMYLAKRAGKNRTHLFDPVADETARERYMQLDTIAQALANGEFVLFYQPKVVLLSGEVIGFEALIRWQHPTRGLLPPAQFIPTLDQHPMAIAVGDWVITTALAQLAQWEAAGFHTSVSVNVDRMQLHDPDFADRLQRQLRQFPSVHPNQLELEILETGALENVTHVGTLIAHLQGMGIDCALDDFGTGYSSLTFLKQLAAHTIKIDQSFVRGMLDDAEHAAIVNSVLGLARNFDRLALAEGVETEAHGQALIEFGCELGQGYAIARPMPADTVMGWMAQWQPPALWTECEPTVARDVPALLAEVEHRAWLKHLHQFVAKRQPQAPELSPHQCRFGKWLAKHTTRSRFSQHPDFVVLIHLHDKLHEEAMQLLTLLGAGDTAAADKVFAEVDALSTEVLASLRALRQTRVDSQWSESLFDPH